MTAVLDLLFSVISQCFLWFSRKGKKCFKIFEALSREKVTMLRQISETNDCFTSPDSFMITARNLSLSLEFFVLRFGIFGDSPTLVCHPAKTALTLLFSAGPATEVRDDNCFSSPSPASDIRAEMRMKSTCDLVWLS